VHSVGACSGMGFSVVVSGSGITVGRPFSPNKAAILSDYSCNVDIESKGKEAGIDQRRKPCKYDVSLRGKHLLDGLW